MKSRPNPYVGPRSFNIGEELFGRDREVNELLDLLIAERIVVLYSPSGAGKTSLVQAGLVPAMQREGFHFFPVMRVSQELDPDSKIPNRYVQSCLASLGDAVAIPAEGLLSFGDCLPSIDNQFLIFDQFEEILTVDPVNRVAKEDFFSQIGAALRDRNRWALFCMREDYLAGLDPYLRPIPTRLSNTYRLDLLTVEAALLSTQEPASRAGVGFSNDAARKLSDDLRRVTVQLADGSTSQQLGLYIEPVQLQVVCRRLWDNLPEDATEIRASDVEGVGDVDTALAAFYADTVAQVATATGVRERGIRDWFERQLITDQGIRGQVLQGRDRSQGLENAAVWALVNSHLVRADKSRGANWFELSHDRLIAPVLVNNAAWREAHLSPLQRQTALWDRQHRPNGLLLEGDALQDAERWAQAHPDLTAFERDFLAASLLGRIAKRREHRRNILIRGMAAVAAIGMVVALAFYLQASKQRDRATQAELRATRSKGETEAALFAAKDQEERARKAAIAAQKAETSAKVEQSLAEDEAQLAIARGAATQAGLKAAAQSDLATLLALGAYKLAEGLGKTDASDASGARTRNEITGTLLRNEMDPSQPSFYLWGHTDAVSSLAFSPDGKMLASGDADGNILIRNVVDHRLLHRLVAPSGGITKLAFSPDGITLVSGTNDGAVMQWNTASGKQTGTPLPQTGPKEGAVKEIGFTPDKRLVLSVAEKQFTCGPQTASCVPIALPRHQILRPEHNCLVDLANSGKNEITVYDLYKRVTTPAFNIPLPGMESVELLAASADCGLLAIRSHQKQLPHGHVLSIWKRTGDKWIKSTGEVSLDAPPGSSPDYYHSFVFSGDAKHLAWTGDAGPHIYDVDGGHLTRLTGRAKRMAGLAFSPDGRKLIAGGIDGSVAAWELDAPFPLGYSLGTSNLKDVVFSPDGRKLAGVDEHDQVAFWDVTAMPPVRIPVEQCGSVAAVAFEPHTNRLIAGLRKGTVSAVGPSYHCSDPPILKVKDNLKSFAFTPDGGGITQTYEGYTKWRWTGSGSPAPLFALKDGWLSAERHWFFLTAKPGENALSLINLVSGAKRSLALSDHMSLAIQDESLQKFSPDGRFLAASLLLEGRIVVMDLVAGGHRDLKVPSVMGVLSVSADLLVTESLADDNSQEEMYFWRLPSMQRLGDPIPGSKAIVAARSGLVISEEPAPLGHKKLAVRDLGTLQELATLPESSNVIFSPDGTLLVTVVTDWSQFGGPKGSRALLWQIDRKKWLDKACAGAGRNLTEVEWAHDFGSIRNQTLCPGLPVAPDVLEINKRFTNLYTQAQAFVSLSGQTRTKGAEEIARAARASLLAAVKLKPAHRIEAPIWSSACVNGVMMGGVGDSAVCDTLLTLDPFNSTYRLYHAADRILLGQGATAIQDLEFLAAHPENSVLPPEPVKVWLEDLHKGKDVRDKVRKTFSIN